MSDYEVDLAQINAEIEAENEAEAAAEQETMDFFTNIFSQTESEDDARAVEELLAQMDVEQLEKLHQALAQSGSEA